MKIFSKTNKIRAGICLFLVALAATFVIPALPPLSGQASADSGGGFHYSDGKYSAIIGTGIDHANPVTFNKKSSTEYSASSPQGIGCDVTITLHSAGATSGSLAFSNCDGTFDTNHTESISIGTAQAFVGTWVDHNHVTVNGVTYTDGQTDDNDKYTADNPSANCSKSNYINGFPNHLGGDPANATATATIHVYTAPSGPAHNTCNENDYPITFQDPNNFSAFFVWVDGGTIQTADGKTMNLTQAKSGGLYEDDGTFDGGNSNCQSTIQADPSNPTHGTLIIRYSDGNPLDPGFAPQMLDNYDGHKQPRHTAGGCTISDALPINIGDTENASKAPGTGTSNGDEDSSSPSLSCNVTFNPLTWVVCPAVQGMISIVNSLDNAISSQLSVGSPGNSDDPNQIFCDRNTDSNSLNNCEAYYQAWSSFRDIGLGLLTVVGLVIIISEMVGVELLDAYTLRKVLPRLIFAAIAITLSWQLMQFFVTLTNDLGYGIRFLIYQPFVSVGLNTNDALNGGGVFAATLVGGAAIVALGIFGLLSFAATAALAVSVAFLTLILRQLLIIILIILAPIAIIAYVLPNTQNGYKLWWNSFSRALLMFPLIAAFIAAGRVFSAISNSGSELGQLMGFVAYFAPYFLIPMTFRFAGGALSTIGGFVNDRHRGGFDRLGQFRKGKFDENAKKTFAGDRWQGNNRAARAFNRVGAGIGVGYKGRFGVGARGAGALDLQRRASARQSGQDEKMQQLAFDDNAIAVMALSGGTSAGARRAAVELGLSDEAARRAVGTANAVGFNDSNTMAAIDLMAQNKSRALQGRLAGQAGLDLVRESATRASHGNRQLAENSMGSFAFHSRNAGRNDFGGEAPGEGPMAGWQRTDVGAHARAFGASTGYYTQQAANILNNVDDHGNAHTYSADERAAATVAMAEMHNILPQATAENQGHINAAMEAIGIDHNSRVSVETQLANIANGRAAADRTVSDRGNQLVHTGVNAQGFDQYEEINAPAPMAQVITANDINGLARKYGGNVPEEARGSVPPTTTTGTTGTPP